MAPPSISYAFFPHVKWQNVCHSELSCILTAKNWVGEEILFLYWQDVSNGKFIQRDWLWRACLLGISPYIIWRNELKLCYISVFIELTTLQPSCAHCLQILGVWTSGIPKGLSRPVWGLLYIAVGEEYQTIRYTACCEIRERIGKSMDCVVADCSENSEL